MATVVSAAGGGNWTTVATWKNVCTGTGAVNTTLTAAQTVTSTTYVASVAFTVANLENIEGFALHLQRSGVTGTLTVGLSNDNGSTYTKEVTVNLSDLPASYSWVFFAFSSALAADGGSDYKVAVKLSSGSSGISIYRGSGTANDWSHILREDTALAALAAGTVFYVMDDLTGAAAKTANTVVMDNIDNTDFGAVTVGLGTLSFGVAAATAYYLKLSGDLTVWGGGVFTIGTVGGAMPSDSSAVLEFDPSSDGQYGLLCKDGSTVTMQGNPITYCWAYLNADAAANATSLTTAVSTGWADNDEIAIASTTRTTSQCEKGALNGAASGTTLTVDGFAGVAGGLANAHSGSAGGPAGESTKAEIVNLTRNIKVRSATSTLMTYICVSTLATCDWDYVQFYYLGENATNKLGIEVQTTTGSFSMRYCSMHDFEDGGFYSNTASGSPDFCYNVTYNLTSAVAGNSLKVNATTGTPVITNNVFLYARGGINLLDVGLTFTDNIFVTTSVQVNENGVSSNWSNITIHSCSSYGLQIVTALGKLTLTDLIVWRGNARAVRVEVGGTLILDGFTAFGNDTAHVDVISSASGAFVIIYDAVLNGEVAYATASGIVNAAVGAQVWLFDSSLGASVAHGTADLTASGGYSCQISAFNTVCASGTEFAAVTGQNCAIRSHKHDASATTFTTKYATGSIDQETAVRHTASGYAWKLTPASASYPLILPGPSIFDTFKAAVEAGVAVTVTAWVRKSAAYTGNAPRLVLLGRFVAGIDADVADPLSVGADEWEQLSVTDTPSEAGVIEWYVDCDGTAGVVYVDDMAVT